MVRVSVYPRPRSSRTTSVGPVGRLVAALHPRYTRTSRAGSLYTVYVTRPAGSVAFVTRPYPSTSNVVVRCSPPPDGVAHPAGSPVKVAAWLVCTSRITFTAAPVAGSYCVYVRNPPASFCHTGRPWASYTVVVWLAVPLPFSAVETTGSVVVTDAARVVPENHV